MYELCPLCDRPLDPDRGDSDDRACHRCRGANSFGQLLLRHDANGTPLERQPGGRALRAAMRGRFGAVFSDAELLTATLDGLVAACEDQTENAFAAEQLLNLGVDAVAQLLSTDQSELPAEPELEQANKPGRPPSNSTKYKIIRNQNLTNEQIADRFKVKIATARKWKQRAYES